MKVLIWFLCIFANALITTIMKWNGIILGGIPTALLFAGTLWLAQTLCKKWDGHKEIKEYKKKIKKDNQQSAQNKTASNSGVVDENQWQCSCGKVYPKYVSSCVCEKSKTDITNQPKPAKTFSETDKMFTEGIDTITDQIRFCRKCGNKLLDNSKYCGKCGTEIISKQ